MNYNILKNYIKKNGMTIKSFCLEINLSEQGFNQAMKKDTLKIRDLEKASEVLKVPIQLFFQNENNISTANEQQFEYRKSICRNCKELEKLIVNQAQKIMELETELKTLKK